ncbi:MAG: DUF6569 family protein [Desulfosoma sp.]
METRLTAHSIVPEDLVWGDPRTHRALGMVPILEGWSVPSLSGILLVEEAIQAGFFHITETGASGQVPFLRVVNEGESPVLILDGEELVGGNQNRIVNTTILVPAGREITIPVSCMEAGRWRQSRADFEAGRAVFRAKSRVSHKESVTESLRRERAFFSDQHAVWREVDESLAEAGAESRTRDFRSARERADEHMRGYVDGLRPVEAQVGAVFYGPQGVLGCELLGSAGLFQKAFEKILKSFAFEVAFSEVEVRRRRKSVQGWWDSVLETPVEVFDSPGAGRDVRLESRRLIGSGLVWNERLVHFSCFPKELSGRRPDSSRGVRRLSAADRRRSFNRRNRGE